MKIFVMGMHRSGTSILMGILSRCGIRIGNNLLMGAKDNPKGHFEDRRFLNINNSLMIKNGGRWDNPPEIIEYQGMKKQMEIFLNQPEWKADKVGWKDPRICFTFPLWYRLIHPEEIRVIYVQRPEIEVAKSLKKRNGIPIEKGKKLYRRYNNRMWDNTRFSGVKRFITHYHSLLDASWKAELEDICDFLNVDFPKYRDLKWIEKFIDVDLWHHRGGMR